MHSLTPRVGAFAQYVGATDVVLLKIPDMMSFAEAASLGTGIGTMGLALFHNLQVPGYPTKPAETRKTVLVYGGSTASGTIALQLLKLSVTSGLEKQKSDIRLTIRTDLVSIPSRLVHLRTSTW